MSKVIGIDLGTTNSAVAVLEGKEPKNARRKILVYQILMDYLWAVWTVIKEAQGDDFGTYGKDRYNRAIENLKKIDL